jgi:tRNA(Ile)-lysidine synthase
LKDRDELIIEKKALFPQIEMTLPVDGTVEFENYGSLTLENLLFDGEILKSKSCATLDAERLVMPLTVRNVRRGDRFAPFGMRGTKLVSDYLTDRKKTLPEKQRQLAVVDREDNIVWLVGEKPSAPYAVTSQTSEVLILRWEQHC